MTYSGAYTDAARNYRWTPGRIALAVLIVLAGVGSIAVIGWKTLRDPHDTSRLIPMTAPPPVQLVSLEGQFNLDNLQIEREEILHGGPFKDGIPSITDPPVIPIAESDDLQPHARVVGIAIDGESRAYPIAMLMQHEAVNDVLASTPVLVVYCPLCDSVSVLDRRMDDNTLQFGISGFLHNSNVLLYDRTDDALWSQIGFEAISGQNAGRSLQHLAWEITTAGQWAETHPESTVLSFDNGLGRDYTHQPYRDYFENDRLRFPITREDMRLPRKTPVVGVRVGAFIKAYPVEEIHLSPLQRVTEEIADQTLVLEAPQTGQVRVVALPDDAEVVHTFWYAWAAIHPQTTLYAAPVHEAADDAP